ncbi:fungal-specific transcription factor domain-containing protein [Aspergillus floccosus]
MFATFNSSMDNRSSATSPIVSSSRPKRSTVARACDWCRLNRVKCDDGQPCKNCRTRGVRCRKGSKSGENNRPSSSAAASERARSQGAEMEPSQGNAGAEEREKSATTTRRNSPAMDSRGASSSQWRWPGAWIVDSVHTNSEPRYYGPSSFLYFTNRLRIYLDESLGQPQLGHALLSFTSSRASSPSPIAADDAELTEGALTRQQEEYLLSLFWQSYHTIIPIVDADDFCTHYNSLWEGGQNATRRPSALVDIVLALCMQYSAALMASGEIELMDLESNDTNTSGHWLYQRCQRLLLKDQDTLSIATLQAYIHSAVYLMNASCLNASHRLLSIAIHVATSLGLPHSPEAACGPPHALRQRIWWTLFYLDSKLSLELGQPYLMPEYHGTVDPPGSVELRTIESSRTISTFGDVNSLSYHDECVKLTSKVRHISSMAFEKCSEGMSCHNGTSIYGLPSVLEQGVSYLHKSMEALQAWSLEVPASLKLARKGNVSPFSTARCALENDVYAPLWLQRQRVLLELLYHNLVMALYRPYIKFPDSSAVTSPSIGPTAAQTSDSSSLCALNHAMATISIVHQVLTETDILNSWNRAFQYTWDATLTVLGFRLVHPVCPHSFSARRATAIANESFKIFSQYGYSGAAQALAVTKEVDRSIDLMVHLDDGQNLPTPPQVSFLSPRAQKQPVLVSQPMQGATALQLFQQALDNLPQPFGLPHESASPTGTQKLPEVQPPFFLSEHPAIMPMTSPTDLMEGMMDQSWVPNEWETGMMP